MKLHLQLNYALIRVKISSDKTFDTSSVINCESTGIKERIINVRSLLKSFMLANHPNRLKARLGSLCSTVLLPSAWGILLQVGARCGARTHDPEIKSLGHILLVPRNR